MILQALTAYYQAMLKQGKISPPGWDNAFKVSYGLVLGPDGTLRQLLHYKQPVQQGKKTVLLPRTMPVPAHGKRTSGVLANFLCDSSSYLLGADAKGKPKRARECFDACAALHREILANVDTPAARAILAFFDTWNPDTAAAHPILAADWKDITGNANLIFCYGIQPATQDPAICNAWQQYSNQATAGGEIGPCLVTGQLAPIATVHPAIKGVRDAQSSGAALISFNAPAFNSYGHEQGMNAPVSSEAAFAYTTAINDLLADREHCRTIGDATVVCWALHGESAYQDAVLASLYGPPEGVKDNDLSSMLNALANGLSYDWEGITLNPGEHFYILALSPNAARVSVRFFLQDSFGAFAKNIRKHYSDIAIKKRSFDKFDAIPLWALLQETVNQKSRNKTASPQLTGDMLRAILSGTPYPSTLINAVELRIRAEREITRGRAGIIKGYYLRLARQGLPQIPEEVLQMELNPNAKDIPYTLGRLFSVYEQIQQRAYPDINATIKDKYFTSASATPARIFPTLGDLAAKHLRVVRRTSTGAFVNFNKQLEDFSAIIGKEYPTRLTLPERGSFQLGYYFENQQRYLKKDSAAIDENKNEEE